jgi:hypothetical protein
MPSLQLGVHDRVEERANIRRRNRRNVSQDNLRDRRNGCSYAGRFSHVDDVHGMRSR